MSQLGVAASKTLTTFAKDLGQWQPIIDFRSGEKPVIITGRNFDDGVDSPSSAYSTDFYDLNYWDILTRGKVQELRTNDNNANILYGTSTGVYRINATTGQVIPVLLQNTNNGFWPWTIALVGGFYYLAQYDLGLWQYDPVNNTVTYINTPAGATIRGVASSYGRLIYLTDTVVGISALDDGTNLTPSLVTAASAQALSIVAGTALKITAIPDGFLVYFTGGILKATYTQQQYVFDYKNLSEGIKLFSPNGVVYIPRLGALAIDHSGLSLTREFNYQDYGIPQPWEINMGEYIRQNILNTLNEMQYGTLDMYFSVEEQKLFISFSSNANEGVMVTCFVYNLISKKWGSFDHTHTGIFEVLDPSGFDTPCAYMSIDGYIREFSYTNFSEDVPDNGTIDDYAYYPAWSEADVIKYTDSGGTTTEIGTTDILSSNFNAFFYTGLTTFGTYQINSNPYSDTMNDTTDDPSIDVSGVPIIGTTYINMDISGGTELFAYGYTLPTIGIDSQLTIGPFRFTDQAQPDEVSSVSQIIIGTSPASTFDTYEDWNTENPPYEDWNSGGGYEDWGANIPENQFSLTLRSCNDGINDPPQGDELLFAFVDLGSSKMYQPNGWSAIYHTLILDASESGDSFSLKFTELSGLFAGRMSELGF